jgi:hypothetical protein
VTPPPPLPPHLRNQIRWGYPSCSLATRRAVLRALRLLLHPHFFVLCVVHLSLCRVLRHVDAPWPVVRSPVTLCKVVSVIEDEITQAARTDPNMLTLVLPTHSLKGADLALGFKLPP